MRWKLSLIAALPLILSIANAYNILVLIPLSAKSHKNVFDPLVNELAHRGHRVTYVVCYETKGNENLTVVNLGTGEAFLSQAPNAFHMATFTPYQTAQRISDMVTKFLIGTYENDVFKKFVEDVKAKKTQYDVVLTSAFINEGTLPIAAMTGAPIVYLSPGHFIAWHASVFDVPNPLSYVPNLLLPFGNKMSFWQRVVNVFSSVVVLWARENQMVPRIQAITEKYIPGHPPILDIERDNVTFYLVNEHSSIDGIHPLMPFIGEVAGMHCRPGKPIPKEFADFIKGAGDAGFVVFSLGSVVRAKDMPDSLLQAFVKAFGRLKQRVIWKYEAEIPNLPSNVKVSSWLPQQDILATPGCKLVITHGGLLSLQEAVYHGVPILGFVPMGADRENNLAHAAEVGFADTLSWQGATEDYIYEKITNMINDPKFKTAAEKSSARFKDRPIHPRELGAYWIEYVARHKGAQHLQAPSRHLNFAQYFLLDILALVGAVLLTTTVITCWAIRKCCCGKKKPAPTQTQQQKKKKTN